MLKQIRAVRCCNAPVIGLLLVMHWTIRLTVFIGSITLTITLVCWHINPIVQLLLLLLLLSEHLYSALSLKISSALNRCVNQTISESGSPSPLPTSYRVSGGALRCKLPEVDPEQVVFRTIFAL